MLLHAPFAPVIVVCVLSCLSLAYLWFFLPYSTIAGPFSHPVLQPIITVWGSDSSWTQARLMSAAIAVDWPPLAGPRLLAP